ncbi:MAG TPA: dihydrolipoamide acetyltransferase family protein [Solirubrobacteraceae bacterium]|nr:dihydrolipoamide acetyltransferase family protein [Solirubrobacteraceae bacterium]
MTSSRTESLVDVTMPQMGVSVAEGTVVGWRVGPGDRIEADQTICDISTDKIDTEVPSPVSGVVTEILVDVDQTVDVGTVMARVAVEGGAPNGDGAPSAPAAPSAAPEPAGEAAPAGERAPARVHAPGQRYSPVVARIAAEHDIDLSTVEGTGRGGRVRKQDVLAVVNGNGQAGGAVEDPPLHIESPYRPDPPAPAPSSGAVAVDGGLSRMRRMIGERMKQSLDTAATCTTWIEVDMSRVEAARAKLGVTALAFVARATVDALREHPALNAWLNGDDYARPEDVNLGIAVSLGDDGLIVPVIHKAQELSVEGLAARIKDIARRARARELAADDVLGATFTITNPGQYGSIMATPIINQPQVGILDLEAVVKRPVVVTDQDGNDSIAIRPMTILGLSWDHRALDGALSAQFLATVKRRLESLPS